VRASSRALIQMSLSSTVAWLTSRRLRAQAVILALCAGGVCAVDFATPGLFDRAGNIKFQDFLPFYVSARIIAEGRAPELYDEQTIASEELKIIGQQSAVRLPNLYGPQVALLFVPLTRLSFPVAARIWVTLSLLIYCGCVYAVVKTCSSLAPYSVIVAIAALAYPPLFHFVVRGQVSAVVLACFTVAWLAFRSDRHWLAGIALGLLIFKPQFLVAVPLVLLLARSWITFATLAGSASAQLALTWACFGSAVMRSYFDALLHIPRWIGTVELNLAPVQMHSLRSFWLLLIPWPNVAFPLYVVSSIAFVSIAAATWRSSSPLALRFAALTLAAVLVNPHLFVYDLLVLAPVLPLLVDCTLSNLRRPLSAPLFLLVYLAYILPLLGPLSRWTHVQLSVPVFAALLWTLWRQSAEGSTPNGAPLLASPDSRVV
jgi:Glycosyltransferase family 87